LPAGVIHDEAVPRGGFPSSPKENGMLEHPLIYEGERLDIRCLSLPDGSSPALSFLEKLPQSDNFKLMNLFIQMAEIGRINNNTKFKKLEQSDGLMQFKSHQIRVFCFRHADTVYLIDGVIKKKDLHRDQDVSRAEQYKRWFLFQQNGDEE
jgi:hypothetical protein